MNRKETTQFLSELLERQYFSGIGKYWAKEVSIDVGTAKGKTRRVDYMQFIPPNQCSVSAIEKGIFACYEIKSCKEDVYSGNGLNFLGEKNYIVTTIQCYKDILPDINSGKLLKHIKDTFPGVSNYFGIIVAIPEYAEFEDEFEDPTALDMKSNWKLTSVLPCRQGPRKRSITELLFCMLRSGH